MHTKIIRFEAKLEKLHKEAQGYLNSIRALHLSEQTIAETIDQFYTDGSPLGFVATQYKDTVNDQQARIELDEVYRMTVLDPIGKFLSIFPEVNELIKKRTKKLLDYDRAKSTVKKLADKPTNDDPTKFPRVIKKNTDWILTNRLKKNAIILKTYIPI